MKYKLTDETIKVDGRTLYRIEAVEDFNDVHAGDKGGFIESERNLSQDGNAWVYGNAVAYGNAWVYGDGLVYGNVHVYGNALVCGNAMFCDKAWVRDNNTGYFNTGDFNSGYYNTGDCNSGNCNSGRYNTGNFNSGSRNSGDFNTGNYNTGYYNTGDFNSGDYNSGNYNTGDFNSGYFNTNEPTVRLFNQDSGLTFSEFENSIPAEFWIELENKELTERSKEFVKNLPNFDANIFKECTGIEIEKGEKEQ